MNNSKEQTGCPFDEADTVKPVNIDWEREFIIDNHGSGCTDWAMNGYGDDGNKYIGYGNYQGDELIEVTEIELT